MPKLNKIEGQVVVIMTEEEAALCGIALGIAAEYWDKIELLGVGNRRLAIEEVAKHRQLEDQLAKLEEEDPAEVQLQNQEKESWLFFPALLKALSWQGGTASEALKEVSKLRQGPETNVFQNICSLVYQDRDAIADPERREIDRQSRLGADFVRAWAKKPALMWHEFLAKEKESRRLDELHEAELGS